MLNADISTNASPHSACVWMLHIIQTQSIKLHIVQALCFDLDGDLDLPLLAVLVGEAISPANPPRVAPIAANTLHADILEDEVPSPLWDDLLCLDLSLLGLFFALLLRRLHSQALFSKLAALVEAKARGKFTFSQDQLGMRDALVCRKEVIVESLTSIFTREMPRLGDGDPQLLASGRVHDKIVDGLVNDRSLALVPWV